MQAGTYVEPTKETVGAYLARWLAGTRPVVSGRTYKRYAQIVSTLTELLQHRPLRLLVPADLAAAYTTLRERGRLDGRGPLSETTLLHHHRVMHTALAAALREGIIGRNVAAAVTPPRKAMHEIAPPDADGLARLFKALAGTALELPVLLAATTGMRRGEILALRWADLDLDAGVASVRRSLEQTADGLRFKSPKSGKPRVAALPSLAVEALRKHKAEQSRVKLAAKPGSYTDGDLVIARGDGTPWPPDSFSATFGKAVRQADAPRLRFHDLRHAFATLMLALGKHPKVVQEALGHSTPTITLGLYSHVSPTMQREAADALDAALRAATRA